MEGKFGVQLKSKDGPGSSPGSPGRSRPPGAGKRTELKTKPVSDLKAMFDKPDSDKVSKAFQDPGSNFTKKATSTRTTEQSLTKTGSRGNLVTTTSKEKVTLSSTSRTITKNKSIELDKDDKDAFEALSVKLKKTGLSAIDNDKPGGASVAVSKTFNGGVAYKATMETKKVSRAGDEDKTEVTKDQALSALSFGLTKLRTRPVSVQKDSLSRSNSIEEAAAPGSPRSESPRPSSPGIRELTKDSKYIPGAAKGWRGSAETNSGRSSPSSNVGKFSDSSVGKLKQESSVPKIQGFRSVSPNAKNSSDDSSSSSNISPRGYKPINSALSPRKDGALSPRKDGANNKKTDVNENIKKFETTKTTSSANVFKSETTKAGGKDSSSVPQYRRHLETSTSRSKLTEKTELSTSSRIKTTQGGLRSSGGDSDKGRQSPRQRDFKWSEKGRLSLEDIKRESAHRPLSRASSSGSNSSYSRGDSDLTKISERYSPEPSSQVTKTSELDNRRKMAASKKLGTGKFLELKKGFENKPDSNPSPSPKLDKKLKPNIKKNILERKQSFEGGEIFKFKKPANTEVISNKERGIKVLETVKSMNQLDAKAKAEPSLVRRTRSLPSDSMEDDSSVDYYEDIDDHRQHYRMKDDVSCEGDISSESDQLYEDITDVSLVHRDRSPNKDRRTAIFRKRKKQSDDLQPVEIPTGSDSDTDYEPIDNDGYQVSESDSVDQERPPELPPARNQQQKKKKTKGEKGTRGIKDKLKKFYKGKSTDTEGALKSVASSTAVAAQPQSGGVLSSIGGKFRKKDLKKSKGGNISNNNSQSNLEALASEDNPYCDSEGTDTDIDFPIVEKVDLDKLSPESVASVDKQVTMDEPSETAPPPPLPPRHSGIIRAPSGGDLVNKNDGYQNPAAIPGADGYLIPGTLPGAGGNSDPASPPPVERRKSGPPPPLELKSDKDPPLPLPPRSRVSQNIDLNLVVPVKPGGKQPKSPQPQACDMRKSGWPPASDSYLHGQRIDLGPAPPPPEPTPTSPDMPYMDDTPSPMSPGGDAPPLPHRPPPKRPLTGKDSYIDVGDMVKPPLPDKSPNRASRASTDSYVDVGEDVLPVDSNYSLADEIRKELEKRPASSAYIKAHDLSSVPEPRSKVTAPFEDMLKFRSECEEDGLYIDLSSGSLVRQSDLRQSVLNSGGYLQPMINSDEQVYGTIGSRYHSALETETLYQVYNTDKVARASKRKAIYSSFDESDEEGYTEDDTDDRVYEDLSAYSSGRGSMELDKKSDTSSTSSKISTLEMFGRKGTVLRTLWSEMEEVKASGVLNTISAHEKKLQEAMFEILTSEATYLKSINILINAFLMSEEFGSDMSNKCVVTKQERHVLFSNIGTIRDVSERFTNVGGSDMSNKCVVTKQERHVLFSNIGTIRDVSERFLSELETGWQKSVMLDEVCDVITKHASHNFECYVHYCSNQTFQDKAVTELKKKTDFLEAIKRLESSPECQGLPMISFLLLPMQRITRLPLLVDAICHRLDPIKQKEKHKAAVNAFNALSKVVKKCNDGAKRMQQTEQMFLIAKQIEFPAKDPSITQIPLVSASRYLVKQGEVVRISSEAGSRIPFGKAKPGKQNIHLFLFNDILVVTKKKGTQYIVTDYAQRNSLHVETIDNPEKHRLLPLGTPSGCKHLFLLVMLENHEKLMVEAVFSCNSLSDKARWVDAVTPVRVNDDQERIYEEWDCPQVQCVKRYQATEPDELTLEESDVINVFKKLDDGMWEGERLRDAERGWFPKDHTVEIINSHVRARNMRTKYRLMAAAEQTNR